MHIYISFFNNLRQSKVMKVRVIIFPFIPVHFSFFSNATNFFIHSLNRFFFFNVYKLLVFFNQAPYMQIPDLNPGLNIIDRKVSIVSINRDGESGGVLRSQLGFRG